MELSVKAAERIAAYFTPRLAAAVGSDWHILNDAHAIAQHVGSVGAMQRFAKLDSYAQARLVPQWHGHSGGSWSEVLATAAESLGGTADAIRGAQGPIVKFKVRP